jgi:hypothetical protein
VIEMRDGVIVADTRRAAVDQPPPLWQADSMTEAPSR